MRPRPHHIPPRPALVPPSSRPTRRPRCAPHTAAPLSSTTMSARSAGAGLPDADLVHALFDYCPAPHQSNCLPLRAGAQVVVFTRHPSGWWDGALDGARGWFPSNHVASYDEMVPRPALDTDTDTDVDLEPSTPVPSALTDSALRLVAHVRAQRCSLYLSDADCIRSAIRDTLQDIFCLHGDDPGAARLVVAARRKHLLSVVHRLVDLAAELSANAPCPSATDTDLITCAYRVISAMSNLLEVAPVSAADPPDGSVSPRTVPMRAKGSAPVLGLRSVALQDGGDSKLNLQEINDACTSMKVVCPIFHRTILEHVRAAALSYPAEKLGAPLTEQTASPSAEKVVDATMAVYDAIHQIIPALDRICLDRQLLSSHGRRIAFLRMTRGEFVSTSHNLLSAVRQLAADDTPDDHEEKKNLALLAAPAISAAAELYHLGEDLLGQVKDIVEDMPPRPSLGNMPARPSRPIHSDQPPGSLSDDGAVRRPRPKKDRGVQPRFSLMASPPENASDDQSKLPHLSTNIESSALLPPPSPVTSSTTTTGASGSATTSLEANSLRHKLSLRGRASSPFSSRRPSMDTLLSKVRRRSALPELNHSKPCIKSSGSVNPHETPDSPDEDEEVVYASGGVVSGGTLAGLVRALIPSKGTMDEKFANTFCFTLPMFTRPADVAEMVLARWLEGGSIQRSNALAFARLWMSDAHWRPDLDDPSPLPALAKLATQAGAADLVAVVTRRSTGRGRSEMRIIASDSQIELFRTIDPPARSAPARDLYSPPHWSGGPHPTASRSLLSRIREGTAKVTDLDTGELARQLTVLVGRVYASITPAEFWVKHAPSSASSHHSSGPAASGLPGHTEEGHMKHLSIISNQIAAWVQTTILACDTIKQRKDALQYFLKLSRVCAPQLPTRNNVKLTFMA